MQEVKMDKATLLEKVQQNREGHRAIFEEALDGYQAEALKLLNGHIERIKNNSKEKVYVHIPQPEDHTSDYDLVLSMIDAEVEDVIILTKEEYRAYVLDDWNWKQNFLTTNSQYSASATQQLRSR